MELVRAYWPALRHLARKRRIWNPTEEQVAQDGRASPRYTSPSLCIAAFEVRFQCEGLGFAAFVKHLTLDVGPELLQDVGKRVRGNLYPELFDVVGSVPGIRIVEIRRGDCSAVAEP